MSHFFHYKMIPLVSGDVLWKAMDTAICNPWTNMLAEALMAGKAHMFLNKSVPDEQTASRSFSEWYRNSSLAFVTVRLDTQLSFQKPDQHWWEQVHVVEFMHNLHSWCHGHFVVNPWNRHQDPGIRSWLNTWWIKLSI